MTTIERAIETYGDDMQLNVAIEEFSELIKEICKYKRGKENIDNITEEMADCYIMLEQIKIIFGIKNSKIYEVMEEKLDRLKNGLDERSENGK
jgi:NTP pyrophosphatase (non-canonical NTP hydrolase)